MCEKAAWLQKEWEPRKHDYYCNKGDYSDGPAGFLYQKEVPKGEEVENFKANHVWLPREYQIRERLFGGGIGKLKEFASSCYYDEFLKNEEKMREIEDRFKDKVDNVSNVKTLVFYMEYGSGRIWNYEKEEWGEIER